MIGNLFSKPTYDDLLDELEDEVFNEKEVESIITSVDIFDKDEEGKTFLHCVANKNNVESIAWLIKKGLDVNAIDKNGNTALMIAARNNAFSAVETLIRLKANANIKNKEGKLAIHIALIHNGISSFKLLKKVTTNLDAKDNNGKTILSYIIDLKNSELLESFIDDAKLNSNDSIICCDDIYKDADILMVFIDKKFDFTILDKDDKTVLFYMVKNALYDERVLEYLLSQNIDINHIDKYGNNVLIELVEAIINSKEDHTKKQLDDLYRLIPIIMEEEVDSSICNNLGENVLSLAVKDRNHKLTRALLNNEVNPNILNDKKQTPLYIAAMIGKDVFDIIFLLLDYGANSNIRDDRYKTVIEELIDAILFIKNKKRIKITDRKDIDEKQDYFIILEEILANSEANLKKLNTNKEPYFFEALKYGNLNVVKLLIKHGSDINQPARNGLNVIYNFIADNKTFRREIDQRTYYTNLKTIISIGADVNSRDDYGGITLHKAILDNDDKTIKILLNSGADINSIDNRGRNILHNTIWQNKIKQFRLIYSYNKKLLNTPDKFGVLPINYAAFLGYEEMVLELIDTDSQVNNPYKKKRYILNFLKRFHKNLVPLIRNTRTLTNKQKMSILIRNMVKEFDIELSEEDCKELKQH